MSISKYIVPVQQSQELLSIILTEEFNIEAKLSSSLAANAQPHFDNLIDDCYLLAETSYVDKVYRDSYYHYFSSKLVPYKRDCVRISVFEGEIVESDFRTEEGKRKAQNNYRGFFIIRPTEPQIIGRNLISPKVLKQRGFLCCMAEVDVTVNSLKVCVNGFPHSSQDAETITCAETTIWAIMEYFGNKYPEYKPVLPSTIITALNKMSFERQIPSQGLNIQQMSFALKEFGFGTRIYSRSYGSDFENLLSIYVESGIPIILGIDNFNKHGDIGHALICIGREAISETEIDAISATSFDDPELKAKAAARRIVFYDWESIRVKYIFIDDNYPVYQKSDFKTPVDYYNDTEWSKCEINHFIVPLYPKIYLEAYEAKNYVYRFLTSEFSPIPTNCEVLIRFFLASSRTFKDSLSLNEHLNEDVKEILLESPMPKFIWVAELSSKQEIKEGKAKGLVLLDATEANLSYNYPLIAAYFNNKLITPDLDTNTLVEKAVGESLYTIFNHNLKAV